jgi:4-hydroxybenzoate polyprenyltransferase
MDKSSTPSRISTTLKSKLKTFWCQSALFYRTFFDKVVSLVLIAIHATRHLFKATLIKIDQFIDYIARHPLLDKLETAYSSLHSKIRQLSLSIQQTKAYQKAALYVQLVRLDKPIGILLLLWPTLIALWIAARGWPEPAVLFVFIAGVILMRSAGCAINDYADRHVDNKVKRTKHRPLTSGKISEKETLLVFATLSLSAFILVLFMNELTIWMSFIGILLAASYPFMKRYHYLPQVHLGAAFGWSAPMAYTAQANEVTAVTWLIFLATILWATAYDTMYAMVDYDDDIKIGVKSTAILFGNQDRLIIGIIQILLILNLILIGNRAELSGFYYLGVTAASVFAVYQQYLIKDRKRELCFQAFLNNNWFGLVLFVGIFLDYQFADLV